MEELLKTHEEYKKKGLKLNEEDVFNRIQLWDRMIDLYIEKKSKYNEERQKIKVEIGKRKIELKEEKNEDGKKKYTESTADAVIEEEFYEQNKLQDVLKLEIELLQEKKSIIGEYINITKKVVFRD